MKNDLNYAAELIRQTEKSGLIRINPIDAGVPKMHFLSLEMGGVDTLREIYKILCE